MSPAKSKSKSKEKASTKASREQQKAVSKVSGSSAKMGNGSPTSAYNPTSGTFHTLDTAPLTVSSPTQNNGRYRNIDETDEHSGSSHGTATEYDSLSNNGSCSGESEEHKEKCVGTISRQEMIPGSDYDKREKIRQKNERKHQRQKERRAQELHDRCCGYLMSRKLEALSQQLVAMGFSSERATLALMLNEGKVEESVSWLFEVSEEEAQKKDLANGANLKLDVSEELTRIAEMEARFKCTKQEVERTVVACEGDLEKAEETLRTQKPEPVANPPKPEEIVSQRHPVRQPEKPAMSVMPQTSRRERESNYVNGGATVSTLSESASRNLQSLKSNQPKILADKRWLTTGTNSAISYPVASPMQVAPSSLKMVAQQTVVGNEGRGFQHLAVREPVIVMQRPQSRHMKQNSVTSLSVSPQGTAGWHTSNVLGVENSKPGGKLLHNQSTGSFGPENLSSLQFYPQTQSTSCMGPNITSSQQYYPQTQFGQQRYISSPVEPAANGLGNSWSKVGASSPPLAVPSSLGLFSGWGSTGAIGSSSHVDWNTGEMMSHCDYNSIDWTLDSKPSSSKTNGLMLELSSTRMGGNNGFLITGLQDGGMTTEVTSSGGAREWTSPFAGKDIFSLPRQFVTSPPSN